MPRATSAIMAPRPDRDVINQNAKLLAEIEQCRHESVLDKTVELGFPIANKPEIGPTCEAYFRAKAARGQFGQFYGLDRVIYPRKGFVQ
jgi:hypothetical protein